MQNSQEKAKRNHRGKSNGRGDAPGGISWTDELPKQTPHAAIRHTWPKAKRRTALLQTLLPGHIAKSATVDTSNWMPIKTPAMAGRKIAAPSSTATKMPNCQTKKFVSEWVVSHAGPHRASHGRETKRLRRRPPRQRAESDCGALRKQVRSRPLLARESREYGAAGQSHLDGSPDRRYQSGKIPKWNTCRKRDF